MREQAFREWMQAEGNAAATVSTRISDAKRIERYYGDLDEAFEADRFEAILETLRYSVDDKAAGKANPSKLDIDGDLYASLAPYRSVLLVYAKFRGDDGAASATQADQIRAFVIEHYLMPARTAGTPIVSIRAGDVHQAMGLQNAFPAVCSVLGGNKLKREGKVELTGREGPSNGANVTFHFALSNETSFGVDYARTRLRERFGEPSDVSQKIVAFKLPDGRSIALQLDIANVQLWLEQSQGVSPPPAAQVRPYAAEQGRHSNLPGRLRQSPDAELKLQGFPRPVWSARIADAAELNQVLEWYDGQPTLNRAALEKMKAAFLARYPDFFPGCFARLDGGYFEEERRYKDALIAKARQALSNPELSNRDLGSQLLDCLTGKESGLLGWRTDGRIKQLRAEHEGLLEQLAGELVRSSHPAAVAIAEFVQQAWPALADGQEKSLPYSESRNIPSMLLALAKPNDAYGINTEPVVRTFRALYGKSVFANQPLSAAEFDAVLSMARQIQTVMSEWLWAPRDLWDVQGFIWAVNRSDAVPVTSNIDVQGAPAVPATNLILYGPPGTGKTYRTAEWAVRLCDGEAPADRSQLKQRYETLVDAGQVGFVTFHQSYSYEDFVEGLRPETGGNDGDEEGTSAGFRLVPRKGIFREIASLAEQARTRAQHAGGYDLKDRNFIKMSLGRAGIQDHIYDAAIDGNYIVLGWGGEVDWSDPKYESYNEVFAKWNELEPNTSGNSGNIAQVWKFRGGMKPGDLVIVSEGNSQFRAIAEVVGDYRYEPTGVETYNHRREVRWLLVLDEPLPVDTIYDGSFTQMSCYSLKPSKIKREALARLLPGPMAATNARPDQFVLVIDEINRANISKVFGELITLLEPDKRLGAANSVRVKLPYSGESFGVPSNLHIIGTMNTADRSIALLDTALRRRFDFNELMPDPETLREDLDGVPLRNMLRRINERIEYLFDREHQVGHAYFIHCQTKADIDRTMRDKIIPLLQEYFYEDWSKVAAVLGDGDGQGRFIERKPLGAPAGTADQFGGEERHRWTVKETFASSAYAQFA